MNSNSNGDQSTSSTDKNSLRAPAISSQELNLLILSYLQDSGKLIQFIRRIYLTLKLRF